MRDSLDYAKVEENIFIACTANVFSYGVGRFDLWRQCISSEIFVVNRLPVSENDSTELIPFSSISSTLPCIDVVHLPSLSFRH